MTPARWAKVAAFVVIGAVVARPARTQSMDLPSAGRLLEQGNAAAAGPTIRAAYGANPSSGAAAFWMGRLLISEDRASDAAQAFERAVAAEPNNSHYHVWLGRAYGTQAQRANVLRQAGLARKTKGAWERAVQLDPNNLMAREDLVDYYLQAPGIMGGGTDKALREAEEIRRRDVVRGTLQFVEIYTKEKKPADAERVLTEALRTRPDTAPLYFALGYVYQNTQRWDQAFEHFERRLQAHPNDHGALFQVGRTGALSGQRLDRAEQALTAYLRANPTDTDLPRPASAHFRLGQVLEKKGDRARARAEYQRSVQLNPQYKPAQDALKAVGG